MMHVRKRERQRFSEACRPLLGDKVDGFWGKVIDVIAIFAVVLCYSHNVLISNPPSDKSYGDGIWL